MGWVRGEGCGFAWVSVGWWRVGLVTEEGGVVGGHEGVNGYRGVNRRCIWDCCVFKILQS
ncbi:hypothetical protein TIFTF001_031609 [Ficus carica]|uniref:Uncharacterized protein n=1 Tax=Ficus carica TaxID=3494 RepID=A0AA88DVP2_FICCA|nr:hypothetical protein TIFTF001_031609 [Ficus carica]